tara:strand:+ start:190 stop:438 length:249 start_codon:yes stop_codon:yes gene_type:complete
MTLFRNLSSIIVNLSTLLYYGFTKLAIHLEEMIDPLWIRSEREHIKRDYDDYDYIEDTTYSYREEYGERNRYGFPKQTKRGD